MVKKWHSFNKCKNFALANLDDLFRHGNHGYPTALLHYGELRKSTSKFDFLQCLSKEIDGNPMKDISIENLK